MCWDHLTLALDPPMHELMHLCRVQSLIVNLYYKLESKKKKLYYKLVQSLPADNTQCNTVGDYGHHHHLQCHSTKFWTQQRKNKEEQEEICKKDISMDQSLRMLFDSFCQKEMKVLVRNNNSW